MSGTEKLILAVDIGGSKYVAGLVGPDGGILWKERAVWDRLSPESVLAQIEKAVEEALSKAGEQRVSAIGLTIPGLADYKTGMWVSSRFMGIYDLPIAKLLQERFGYPVYLDNDCQACALAEKRFGTCRDCGDFLYLTVSNGVGGALVLNGRLYYGAFGNAGEFGQCVVEGDSPQNGKTLETLASGRGLSRRYLEAGGKALPDGTPPEGRDLVVLAEEGDPAARFAFEREGYYLGLAISNACKLLDPGRVVIGGGLSLAYEQYRVSLEETLRASYRGRTPPPEVCPSVLGYDGGLLGAAAVALERCE